MCVPFPQIFISKRTPREGHAKCLPVSSMLMWSSLHRHSSSSRLRPSLIMSISLYKTISLHAWPLRMFPELLGGLLHVIQMALLLFILRKEDSSCINESKTVIDVIRNWNHWDKNSQDIGNGWIVVWTLRANLVCTALYYCSHMIEFSSV